MKTRIVAILLTLVCARTALAAPGLTLGVLLPTTVGDGEQRFALAEKLAAALGHALGAPVQARNFARYSDFAEAARSGRIDVGVVDAFIAAEASPPLQPIALASIDGATRRPWAVMAHGGHSVATLEGKRLAVTRGAGSIDAAFVGHAIFDGALQAEQAFQLSFVPSLESALRMWTIGSAEAVLLPAAAVPAGAHVLFRSPPLPIAAVVAFRGDAAALTRAFVGMGAIAPFDGFVAGGADEMSQLRQLILKGPPARPPVLVEAPPPALDLTGLVTFGGLQPVFPDFVELMHVSKDLPDD